MESVRKLIVIGCGPHFFDRYLSVLEEHTEQLDLVLAMDLECAEARVRAGFANRVQRPKRFLFLPDAWRVPPDVSELGRRLGAVAQDAQADAVLICTEPKAHKAFALWALE